MPVNAYYKGHGDEVMGNMQKEYGDKKGKSVFYVTANKRGVKPMAQGGMVVPMFEGGMIPSVPDDPMLMKKRREEEIARMLGGVQLPPQVDESRSMGVPPPPSPAPPQEPEQAAVPPPEPVTNKSPEMAALADRATTPPDEPGDTGESGTASVAESPNPELKPIIQPSPSPTPNPAISAPPATLAKSNSVAMGPLRNQEQATKDAMDYARAMVTKTNPRTGAVEYKRPAVWQTVLGAAMQLSPRTKNIDVHPNLTREYQNLDILAKRANEERQAQVAQSTEEYHRAMAGAAMARAERDTAKSKNPTQWQLLQDAANSPDPTVREQAAKTLKLKEDTDIRTSGGRASAGATGRLMAGRDAPAYVVKPGTSQWRVSQDLAYGKIDFADFQRLYSRNMDSGMKAAIYDQAREMNPSFSPKDFEAGYKMASNPKIVAQLASLDNVIMGVPDLLNISDMASRTGVTVLNHVVNKGGYMIGGQHYSDFATARKAFADELSGALGYGSATDMSREMAFDMTDPNLSPENFQSAVENVVVPFVQRKRYSITRTMGPYGDRVAAPNYQPHVPAGSAPPTAPAPPSPPAEATNPALRAGPAQAPAPASRPAASNPTSQYVVGGIYGGKTYLGPDPNLAASWR